jgi:hypothetical protein
MESEPVKCSRCGAVYRIPWPVVQFELTELDRWVCACCRRRRATRWVYWAVLAVLGAQILTWIV